MIQISKKNGNFTWKSCNRINDKIHGIVRNIYFFENIMFIGQNCHIMCLMLKNI